LTGATAGHCFERPGARIPPANRWKGRNNAAVPVEPRRSCCPIGHFGRSMEYVRAVSSPSHRQCVRMRFALPPRRSSQTELQLMSSSETARQEDVRTPKSRLATFVCKTGGSNPAACHGQKTPA
jgi:hypothetical protein